MKGLYRLGRLLATLQNSRCLEVGRMELEDRVTTDSVDLQPHLSWKLWEADYLFWEQVSALELLNGAGVQYVLEKDFILLNGKHLPPYSTRPGVEQAVFAEIEEAPEWLTPPEIFLKLHERAAGH